MKDLWNLPHGILEYVCITAGVLYFYKQIPNLGIFTSFIPPRGFEEEIEMEFERALPRNARYLLPGLRTVACLVTLVGYWCFHGSSDLVWKPLQAFSSNPWWGFQLLYAYIILWVTAYVTPEISLDFFGLSFIGGVVSFFVYPYVFWLNWKRKILSATFILGSSRRSESRAVFKYAPIDQKGVFRLLNLTKVGGRISATLQHFPVDNCPPYWAVSYVWGRDTKDHAIILDSTGGSYLPITESCASVLKLLTPFQTRYLWIDQICIDQAKDAEKELQVPLMSDIYRGAEQVIAV